MSIHSKVPRATALQLLGALSLLFLTLDTQAVTISPSPSYDGNYVVTWSTTLGCTVEDIYPYYPEHCYSLQENGVDIGASGYSKSVTGKPAGSYEYQVYYRMSVYGSPYDEYTVEGPASVIVGTPPPRDTIPTQLTYQYETRAGDLNGDGRTDILVKRTSGGVAGNGVLEELILLQNASGGFWPFVPDSYYSTLAAGWPLSSATTVITDFNVDGYVDVEVKEVSAATGGAVSTDQIIYSSGVPLQPQPLGLRPVDASLKQFVGNALDYFHNPAFFVDNATVSWFEGYYEYYYCSWLPGYGGGVIESYSGTWDCYGGIQPYYGYVEDYTGFSAPGVAIWTMDEGYRTGAVSAASSTEQAQDVTEEVLGVEVGGWPMEEELGPTGEHADPDQRRGLETFWAILGIAQRNAEQIETEEAPPQAPGPQCSITVNARRVTGLGFTSQHGSVVYTPGGAAAQWVSAFDSDPSAFGNGLLVSAKNEGSDHPRLTQIVSPVSPPGGFDCPSYWLSLSLADHNYDDDLPYHPVPNGSNGYNSNGYVHGILNATGGSATVGTMDRLWGWGTPVPNNEFQ